MKEEHQKWEAPPRLLLDGPCSPEHRALRDRYGEEWRRYKLCYDALRRELTAGQMAQVDDLLAIRRRLDGLIASVGM